MKTSDRRQFLVDVGRGMLISSVGMTTAAELGLAKAVGSAPNSRLTFGSLEPLVSLLQETAPEDLLPKLVGELRKGVKLKSLVSAGALANVRAFAGQDYIGYHTFMALFPALKMSEQLPIEQQALPVLKVLYRNSRQIQDKQRHHEDALHPVAKSNAVQQQDGKSLQGTVREVNWGQAESQFAALCDGPANEAFNQLQYVVQDEVDVHRVVLSWRSFAMLDVAGTEFAHSLLRQSVLYCLDAEQRMHNQKYSSSEIRNLLPRLLSDYRLGGRPIGNRQGDDRWLSELSSVIFAGTREQAAEAVAMALAEGYAPEHVGEAISIAANQLLLHDPGRLEKYSTEGKPPGCVHGDSVGVHASDAANAWRHISRVGDSRNRVSSLIVGAFHTAGQLHQASKEPYPFQAEFSLINKDDAAWLLAELEESILENNQARACALAHRYGELNLPTRPLLDQLLKYAVSEDGALHAEKYYQTVQEEFATTRPSFRWRQIIGLARVTASEYGYAAPGYQEARELLSLS